VCGVPAVFPGKQRAEAGNDGVEHKALELPIAALELKKSEFALPPRGEASRNSLK